MGGDRAPEAVITGAIRAHERGVPVVLAGDPALLSPRLPKGIDVLPAAEVVTMDDDPARSVRKKPNSSMRACLDALGEGRACAAVSCGNTGAFMAAATLVLGRIEGVSRPAITTVVPRIDGGRLVIADLGANIDCKPEHLEQFGLMGEAFARTVLQVEEPRVGLLSNGEEDSKGNELVRAARARLEVLDLHFVGYVEPRQAFQGRCDVLVCDGFVGNILLKTVEATAEVVGTLLKEEIMRRRSTRIGAWLMQGALARFRERTDYATIGGALLLGVRGVVVVGHGRSDAAAVESAVVHAYEVAGQGLVDRIEAVLR